MSDLSYPVFHLLDLTGNTAAAVILFFQLLSDPLHILPGMIHAGLQNCSRTLLLMQGCLLLADVLPLLIQQQTLVVQFQ